MLGSGSCQEMRATANRSEDPTVITANYQILESQPQTVVPRVRRLSWGCIAVVLRWVSCACYTANNGLDGGGTLLGGNT